MQIRWGTEVLLALAMLPLAERETRSAQEKKSHQEESQKEQEQPEQEADSRRERIRIRVLSDPRDISSFYRRSGGSSYPYYAHSPARPYGTYLSPVAPDSVSDYYRSPETGVSPRFFYPGAYPGYEGAFSPCCHGRRGLFDRASRPGFFLETLPRGSRACPCPWDRNAK